MFLQSLILVFLKVSLSNSYPLKDDFELVGNGIDSIGGERDCGSKLELNAAWNGRGTGYLYVPIPMDVESWKVTLTFSSPVTHIQVWDVFNIECTGNVCMFENQGYNEVQSAGTQLKIDFLIDFVSELPDLVGLTVNDVDVCTGGGGGPIPTPTTITTTITTTIITTTTEMKPTPTPTTNIWDKNSFDSTTPEYESNISTILPWKQKVTRSSTLLLVAGGFSGSYEGGLINDIELISGENNTACSKSAKPIFGKKLEDGWGETFYEGDALGMTGQFTKGAAIICGGKNKIDNLNVCYEYNHTQNEWYGIPSMDEKRYNPASALIEDNLWIIGGSDGSDHSKITEMYEYTPNGLGKWKKNLPLPIELQKSGISSQCAVTINSSSVFMAGGYQDAYRIITNETTDEIEAPIAGGKTLSNSWMFYGSSWKALPEMSTPRDRPACSLMHINGSIRVLVAGGCKGWCVKTPGIVSAEMYDPVENTWTAVADLPVGLNSHKMELLDGLPTIIGGYNGETQNGILYQYHVNLNQWIPHPDAEMRIPRSSPAVFQVPRHLFPLCLTEN